LIALIALVLVTVSPNPAQAHGGGTDAYGCHTNHKTGDYHCHGSGRSRESYSPRYSVADHACVGASFQDPTDSAYTYCRTSDGYGISKGGLRTGTAAEGTSAYAAIKAIAPVTSRPQYSTPLPVANPNLQERPSIYEYIFRAFLGIMSMFYIGATLIEKDVRGIGCGWHLILGGIASWSLLYAVGVVSIGTYLCPFATFVALVIIIGSLVG